MKQIKVMPYYMACPLALLSDAETEYGRDLAYFRQIYPQASKKIQKEIIFAVDMIDYDGSMIYDEYPDRVMMDRLRDNILNTLNVKAQTDSQLLEITQQNIVGDLVFLLLVDEVMKRRHKNNLTMPI